MCLVLKQSEYTGIKTASRQIVCYKMVAVENGKLVSPVMSGTNKITYELDKPNKEISIEPSIYTYKRTKSIEINEGYHSIKSLLTAKEMLSENLFSKYKSIYKCIIPKGSKYIRDEKGYMVSSNIILKEHVPFYYVQLFLGYPHVCSDDLFESYEKAKAKFNRLYFVYNLKDSTLIFSEENDEHKCEIYMSPNCVTRNLLLLKR